jgi:hypothetical protein
LSEQHVTEFNALFDLAIRKEKEKEKEKDMQK